MGQRPNPATLDLSIHPDASAYTESSQAMARAQRVAPVILWCKQCGTVNQATTAPCCDAHGYTCPECGSDADSVRPYSVAEAQQIAAGGSHLAAPFAAVLAQLSMAEPPATAVPPDYVVIFLAGGVITDWQYLSAAEAQLALVDWTDNDTEKRSGPWDHCLVYSAESDSGDRDAWAFPLDYVGLQAAEAAVAIPAPAAITPPPVVTPVFADVDTVLALRPEWSARKATRFLAEKARDLAAGAETTLTELLTNELNQWETHR